MTKKSFGEDEDDDEEEAAELLASCLWRSALAEQNSLWLVVPCCAARRASTWTVEALKIMVMFGFPFEQTEKKKRSAMLISGFCESF